MHSIASHPLDGVMQGSHASGGCALVPCLSSIGMRHVFINLLSAWLGGLIQGRHISSAYALLACIRCITIRHVFDNLLCLLWIDAREACLQCQ